VIAAFRSTQTALSAPLNRARKTRRAVPRSYIVIGVVFILINIALPMAGDTISSSDILFITLPPLLCSLIPFFPRPASIAYSACWLALLVTPHAYVSDMIPSNMLFHFFIGRFRPRKKVVILIFINETAHALAVFTSNNSNFLDMRIFLFNAVLAAIFTPIGVTVCQAEKFWRIKAQATEQRLNEVRNEIAKEMHDLVAYSMSQAVLRARLAAENPSYPQEAREDFSALAGTGADALHELRILLYALQKETEHSPSPTPEASVQPYQNIKTSMNLVAQDLHNAGFQVDCHVAENVTLSRGQTSILSRVLREVAANIIRHGDPTKPASLLISRNQEHIQLLAANSVRESRATPLPSSGMGMLSMQERLSALDGTLTTSNEDGTWLVSAIVPLSSVKDKEHTV